MMDGKLADMNVADLVKLWADTDNGEVAEAVVAELQARLTDDPENTAVAAALAEVSGEPPQGAAGPQAGGGEATVARSQSEQTWVVQRTDMDQDVAGCWIDVATVTVPARTKRKTIVEKALEQAPKHKPPEALGFDVAFRVLDADSAAEIAVGWDVPPAPAPELRIG